MANVAIELPEYDESDEELQKEMDKLKEKMESELRAKTQKLQYKMEQRAKKKAAAEARAAELAKKKAEKEAKKKPALVSDDDGMSLEDDDEPKNAEAPKEEKPSKEDWNEKLSYSSFAQFIGCKRKYFLRKVTKAKVDTDVEQDTKALRFGTAFHALLEDCKHLPQNLNVGLIKKAAEKEKLDPVVDGSHLFALLRHYKKVRTISNLEVVNFEIEVNTPNFLGYVDFVAKDKDGGWWIGDLKTASMFSPLTVAKLHTDWQLNLYAKHVQEIASQANLKVEDFKGCLYTVAVKSKLKHKDGETFKDYATRLTGSVSCYEVPIPKEEMDPEAVYETFKLAHAEIKSVHKMSGVAATKFATPNYGNCNAYFKSCEYWSQCHGKTFTETKDRKAISSV